MLNPDELEETDDESLDDYLDFIELNPDEDIRTIKTSDLIEEEAFKKYMRKINQQKFKTGMIVDSITKMLRDNMFSEEEIEDFLYTCALRSKMKTELETLLRKYRKLNQKTVDRRRKFSSKEIRHIKSTYLDEGEHSIKKTLKILRSEGMSISERYLYKLCKGLYRPDNTKG